MRYYDGSDVNYVDEFDYNAFENYKEFVCTVIIYITSPYDLTISINPPAALIYA